MRLYHVSLVALAIMAAAAPAQQPGNPAVPQVDPRLDTVLGYWEKAMLSVQTLDAEVRRTKLDKTFQTTDVFKGHAKYQRGGTGQHSRASLELFKENQPQVFEKLLFTGNFVYTWLPVEKKIRRYEMPPPKGQQLADDNFASFLFGMKAEDAKKRYIMTYVPPQPNDKWYQYLRIQPKEANDKAEFTEARLVLLNSTYLPRQLWFLEPNKTEVTWDFPKVASPANVTAADFGHPQLPAGWTFDAVPLQQNLPPRVLRNNGQ